MNARENEFSSADGILTRSQRPLVRDIIVNEKINLYPLFIIQIDAHIIGY